MSYYTYTPLLPASASRQAAESCRAASSTHNNFFSLGGSAWPTLRHRDLTAELPLLRTIPQLLSPDSGCPLHCCASSRGHPSLDPPFSGHSSQSSHHGWLAGGPSSSPCCSHCTAPPAALHSLLRHSRFKSLLLISYARNHPQFLLHLPFPIPSSPPLLTSFSLKRS